MVAGKVVCATRYICVRAYFCKLFSTSLKFASCVGLLLACGARILADVKQNAISGFLGDASRIRIQLCAIGTHRTILLFLTIDKSVNQIYITNHISNLL